MIKQTSSPVLTVIVLLLIINVVQRTSCAKATEPPDLTLIFQNTTNSETVEVVCVAEGNVLNSAIGWAYPTSDTKETLPKIVSSYVPEIKNDYNCDFVQAKPCSVLWQMKDWQYSKFNAYNFKPILDTRWEAFPTVLTSNTTKEFKASERIPNNFQMGLSVRAAKNAEIFLCESWDPHGHPCYYINIGGSDNKQVFLRKYKSVPEKLSKNDTKLTKKRSEVGILSEGEWRNFELSLDGNGTLKLTEMATNTIMLNYTDETPYHPIYLFMRSKYNTALWKIHNNQYIFTNKTQYTQLGPTFGIYGSNLCVSLYVAICKNCKMSFSMLSNGEKQILKEVFNENKEDDLQWTQIKLLAYGIFDDQVKLFVETKYKNNTVVRNGFWAIDDVRICAEDEIKVTRLSMKTNIADLEKSHFSCHALNFPRWRPLQHTSSSAAEKVKYTASTPTSIRISWKSVAGSEKTDPSFYLAQYEGKDICKHNPTMMTRSKLREKSQGYVIGRRNEIIINNLTSYTNYNVTLWNIIQGNKQSQEISTLPTDVPTKEEIPRNVTMQLTDTSNEISWGKPKCNEIYGPVIYQIRVKTNDGNDTRTFTDIQTTYKLENLLPFTKYSLEITTARQFENLNNTKLSITAQYNFSTYPGIAPAVENLELYATDKSNAYLRYDLPINLQGIPKQVQIQWCHPLFVAGCKTIISNLTKCSLWNEKYCLEVNNLVHGYDYKFIVAIKNNETSSFGKAREIMGTALEKVPGTPVNITYEMVHCNTTQDYCDLNISWAHPYNQNATITMFNIILNETSYDFVADTVKNIHEILKIKNKEYQPTYSHIVKYITFSTPYKISVRAANDKYGGEFASVAIKTDDIGQYIDQTPKFINTTNETISFQLPGFDWRLNSSTLIVIVQDYDTTKTNTNEEVVKLQKQESEIQLCNEYGDAWIAKVVEISNTSSPLVTIGDGTSSYFSRLSTKVVNKPLKPDSEYCFTFALMHRYKNSETFTVYHEKHFYTNTTYTAFHQQEEKPDEGTNIAAYLVPVLFILLLVACGLWLTHRYMKNRRLRGDDGDHVYESMPFEDYVPDAVSNQTYDKLMHD